MQYMKVGLWMTSFACLGGFSAGLAFTMDFVNILFFHIKMTFGFINLIFTEHVSWLRILWRIMKAKRFNSVEGVLSFHIREFRSSTILLT